MNRDDLSSILNIRVLLGALGIAGFLLLITFIFIGWKKPDPTRESGFAPADLTVIPAPTSTPEVTPTFTPDPLIYGTPTLAPDVIGVGGYVQITGTEGSERRGSSCLRPGDCDVSLWLMPRAFRRKAASLRYEVLKAPYVSALRSELHRLDPVPHLFCGCLCFAQCEGQAVFAP